MSLAALDIYRSNIQQFVRRNWKYVAIFALGSFISSVTSLFFAKRITAKTFPQLLFSILLHYKATQFRNVSIYNGFRIPPKTRPSSILIAFNELMAAKFSKAPDLSNQTLTARYKERRKGMANINTIQSLPSFLMNHSNSFIEKRRISPNIHGHELNGFLLKYPGCSLKNGLIIYYHGGAFHCGDPSLGYPMLCVMMQYLGCCALGVEYELCPENNILQIVDECVEAYKYAINTLHIAPENIFIIGDSAGGSICLLLIQKLKKLSLEQPGGAVILSGITDLTWNTILDSGKRSGGAKDLHFATEYKKLFELICIDANDTKECNGDCEKVLSLAKYSPINGDWDGLCPLFVSASVNEMVFVDNEKIVRKCKEFNIDVEYEWSECLPHTTALWCGIIPEARDTLIIIIDWVQRIKNKR